MNAAHIHLMMTHVPLIGTFAGLGLLAFGLARKSQELKKAALGILVIAALIAVPVYLTGEPAEDLLEAVTGVSHASIERHEEAATIAFATLVALGAIALVGLIWRRKQAIPGWFLSLALAGSIVSAGMMAWTANLGGKVRHTEISQNQPAAADENEEHHE
jgi:hypothetical protein